MSYETAEAIKSLRSALGVSQESLAREIGVSWRTIARYEAGGNPDLVALAKLEKYSFDNGLKAHSGLFQALIDSQVGKLLVNARNARIAADRIKKAIDQLSDLAQANQALIPSIARIQGDLNVALNRMWEINPPKGLDE